ncbi:unnamed protein product [Moneuplotes crassus]|uniref:Uncharacterized protein n=1 Tax=Euplotes crassus TaxID=5936 RepID=A0AAD1XPA1_EUPCR|nr:unnamed protein product [Moneuplotes crassus]
MTQTYAKCIIDQTIYSFQLWIIPVLRTEYSTIFIKLVNFLDIYLIKSDFKSIEILTFCFFAHWLKNCCDTFFISHAYEI